MKNAILVVFVCGSLVFCAAGCAASQTREVTKADNGSSIALRVGDTLVITLEGNITTGYQWALLPNRDGVVELQGEPEYVANGKKLMGAGGVYHFTFKAIKAGSTRLDFKYYRSFEPADVAPAETFSIDVNAK